MPHPTPPDCITPLNTSALLQRWLRRVLGFAFSVVCSLLVLWSLLAVKFCAPLLIATPAALLLIAFMLAALFLARPWWKVAACAGAVFAVGLLVFLLQIPSNNRAWTADVALLPWAAFDGDQVTIHNIRRCAYQSENDFVVTHHDDSFQLSQMTGVDLFHVFWGSPLIAHTMVSFVFNDGRAVCFSIETRREQGEVYSALQGFFRQYEITYVIADEVDLVKLRTNFRGEQVYLYRVNVPIDKARLVFLDYLQKANSLRDQPQWYNALTDNCTTSIIGHSRHIVNPHSKLDWRMLLNGYITEMMYERGTIDTSIPFQQLQSKSLINDLATQVDDDANFSRRIRSR